MRRSWLILSALLFVLPAAASPAGAEAAIGVAMDDFSYTDTSAEPANQTAAHERRLSAFTHTLDPFTLTSEIRGSFAKGPRFTLSRRRIPTSV